MKVIILAGGAGTRLWPYSRERGPKQILPLLGKDTLLQQTYGRLLLGFNKEDILIVTGERWQRDILKQLPNFPRRNLLLEPARRDSAGAIGLALAYLSGRGHKDEVIISVHADHWLADGRAYAAALKKAAGLAAGAAATVVVGVKPTYPETGYGYIQVDKKVVQAVWRAKRFIEKPPLARARRFLAAGNYFWNVGWFAWRLSHLWDLYAEHLAANFSALKKISTAAPGNWQKVVRSEFPKLQSVSIDKGIAEKAKQMLLVSTDIAWSDIGHWRSVHEISTKDKQGNAVSGNSLLLDSHDNLFVAPAKKLIVALGASGMILVDTPDAILLADKNRAQDVKKIVEKLKNKKSLAKYL